MQRQIPPLHSIGNTYCNGGSSKGSHNSLLVWMFLLLHNEQCSRRSYYQWHVVVIMYRHLTSKSVLTAQCTHTGGCSQPRELRFTDILKYNATLNTTAYSLACILAHIHVHVYE